MDPQTAYQLGAITIRISGPLLLAMALMMYLSVYVRTRSFPKPNRVIFEYVRINVARRQHAGILTYGFILCALIFMAALGLIVYSRIAG